MKTELVQTLTATFEGHAQQTEGGVEFWLARDLQHLLGYSQWDNLHGVLGKANTPCDIPVQTVADQFSEVGQMVSLGPGRQQAVNDIQMTRAAG